MSTFPPVRSFCVIAFLHLLALARRRLATFSNIAIALRSNRAIDLAIRRALFAPNADRLPLRANVARASRDLYSPMLAPTLPFALLARRTCVGKFPLPR